jgi:hypothetical protein
MYLLFNEAACARPFSSLFPARCCVQEGVPLIAAGIWKYISRYSERGMAVLGHTAISKLAFMF